MIKQLIWPGLFAGGLIFLWILARTLRARRRRYTSDRHQWWSG